MSRDKPHVIPDDDGDFPFDEQASQDTPSGPKRATPSFFVQTGACIRELASTKRVQPHNGDLVPVLPTKRMSRVPWSMSLTVPDPRPASPPPAPSSPRESACGTNPDCILCAPMDDPACAVGSVEAMPLLFCSGRDMADDALLVSSDSAPIKAPSNRQPNLTARTIGPAHFRVYQTQIPDSLLPLLHPVVTLAEDHARHRPGGWQTNLYSLTKQDLPLAEIPGGMSLVQPLTDFVVWSLQQLYRSGDKMWSFALYGSTAAAPSSAPPCVRMDANQPHVLKYDLRHRGVGPHHDRCDVTAQLMLSRSGDYTGGGTRFPDIGATVGLERGEVLFHPGSLVHAGEDIATGTRLLLVWFVHL